MFRLSKTEQVLAVATKAGCDSFATGAKVGDWSGKPARQHETTTRAQQTPKNLCPTSAPVGAGHWGRSHPQIDPGIP